MSSSDRSKTASPSGVFSGSVRRKAGSSTGAGAGRGQLVRPAQFRSMIRGAGRIPAERTTTYDIRRVCADPADDPVEPLDTVEYDEQRFGTFNVLLHQEENRFRDTFSGVGGRSAKGRKGT